MRNDCPFSNSGQCEIWLDYQIAVTEADEASDLLHRNWIEIQHQYDRIILLEGLLRKAGIDIPPEY